MGVEFLKPEKVHPTFIKYTPHGSGGAYGTPTSYVICLNATLSWMCVRQLAESRDCLLFIWIPISFHKVVASLPGFHKSIQDKQSSNK